MQETCGTRSADLAAWLVYKKHRCSVVSDDNHRAVCGFTDSAALQADITAFRTATASAPGLLQARAIVTKLARAAAYRRMEWERRIAAGAETRRRDPAVGAVEDAAQQPAGFFPRMCAATAQAGQTRPGEDGGR